MQIYTFLQIFYANRNTFLQMFYVNSYTFLQKTRRLAGVLRAAGKFCKCSRQGFLFYYYR